jgi:hypothetical protein
LSKPLPYIENGNLKITDADGNDKKLVDSSANENPTDSKTSLTTGTWNRSDPSVFYAGSGGSNLYRVNESGSTEKIKDLSNDGNINGVMDIGDINGDGDDELVYIDGSQSVRYLYQNGTSNNLENAGVGSNSGGLGAGELVEDKNGRLWAAISTGGNNIKLVTDDGGNTVNTISSSDPFKSSVTAADVDDDGDSEIVYVDSSNDKVEYIDNPFNSPSISTLNITSNSNNKVDPTLGVVSS